MIKKIVKAIFISMMMCLLSSTLVFASSQMSWLSGNVNPDSFEMTSEGVCKWDIPAAPEGYAWKRFQIQLLKRVTTVSASTGIVYSYKTYGSVKYAGPDDTEIAIDISSVGYYQFQFRPEDLEGNYGAWVAMYDSSFWKDQKKNYPGIEVTEDDITVGGNSGSGSGSSVAGGPGVVQTSELPIGYQYAVVGPNGEILYYYGGNTSNSYYPNTYQYSQGSSQYYGPGFVNNGNQQGQILYPQTGVSGYPVVPTPGTQFIQNGTQVNPMQQQQQTIQGTTPQTNPNYSSSVNINLVSPQVTQGMEIGWHVDGNGRFYYQGNGQILKGTWYLIDNSYYRFSDTGYLLMNKWFHDTQTGSWYYLSVDGKMVTGWQKIDGVWYYFKPENGNGYGTMYSNTSIFINDNQYGQGMYAFDSNGATVMNAWYGGFYYGQDGKRQN